MPPNRADPYLARTAPPPCTGSVSTHHRHRAVDLDGSIGPCLHGDRPMRGRHRGPRPFEAAKGRLHPHGCVPRLGRHDPEDVDDQVASRRRRPAVTPCAPYPALRPRRLTGVQEDLPVTTQPGDQICPSDPGQTVMEHVTEERFGLHHLFHRVPGRPRISGDQVDEPGGAALDGDRVHYPRMTDQT